jgi:hypothetical protein
MRADLVRGHRGERADAAHDRERCAHCGAPDA